MPVLLELFCGTKSIGKVFERAGWDVVSVDFKKKFEPTICKNILDLTVDDVQRALPANVTKPDAIWASPTCTQYSRARTRSDAKPRDLEGSDKQVQKVLDLVAHYQVPFFMENPETGLLKTREVVKGVPRRVIDYCSYADESFAGRYRKRTAIWTNTDWVPERSLCVPSKCKFCSNGRTHDHEAQNRSNAGKPKSSTLQLYRIPSALPEELVKYLSNVI